MNYELKLMFHAKHFDIELTKKQRNEKVNHSNSLDICTNS